MSKAATSMNDLRESMRELAKAQAEAMKIVGDLGTKWGSYTEGQAAPAVERVLREKFGAQYVVAHAAVSHGGLSQEFDTIGIVNGKKKPSGARGNQEPAH